MEKFRFNIQLFAAETQTTEASHLSAEMKTFYDTALIKNAKPNLVHDQFGEEKPIPQNNGKKIEFRKFSSLKPAMTPLVEGVTPDGNKLEAIAVTATVGQYGDYVEYSDMLKMTTVDPYVSEVTAALAAQAGLTKDHLTRNELIAGTNVVFAEKIDADGTVTPATSRAQLTGDNMLNVRTILRAAAILKAQNAPTINGSYIGIIHPYAKYDLLAEAGKNWTDIASYGEHIKDIMEGEIGKIGNVRFVETSEAKVYAKGKDNCPNSIFCTLVLGAGAFGKTKVEGGGMEMIVKQLGSGNDPLNQRATVGWKMTHVAKRLKEENMVRIESCSKQFADIAEN